MLQPHLHLVRMEKNLGCQFRHFSLGGIYPLMLFESINYYLGWLPRNNIAILCQLYQLVGLKVMVRTEAFAFLTSRIAIWPSRIWRW